MEHVSSGSSQSVKAGGNNPFLDDVVKPFLDYGQSKGRVRTTSDARRRRGAADNPFHSPESEAAEGRGGGSGGRSHVLQGRGKSEETETGSSYGGEQEQELSSAPSPTRGGGGSGEAGLDPEVDHKFNALLQLLDQPVRSDSEMTVTNDMLGMDRRRLPPPPPPARTSSLVKPPEPLPKSTNEEESTDVLPFCLSAETTRRFAVDYEVEQESDDDEFLVDQEIKQACFQNSLEDGGQNFSNTDSDSEISVEDQVQEIKVDPKTIDLVNPHITNNVESNIHQESYFSDMAIKVTEDLRSADRLSDVPDSPKYVDTVTDVPESTPEFACSTGGSRDEGPESGPRPEEEPSSAPGYRHSSGPPTGQEEHQLWQQERQDEQEQWELEQEEGYQRQLREQEQQQLEQQQNLRYQQESQQMYSQQQPMRISQPFTNQSYQQVK